MDSFEGETFIETQRDLYYSYSCKYIYLDFRRQNKYFFVIFWHWFASSFTADLKIRGRRRQRKHRLKSELAFFQSSIAIIPTQALWKRPIFQVQKLIPSIEYMKRSTFESIKSDPWIGLHGNFDCGANSFQMSNFCWHICINNYNLSPLVSIVGHCTSWKWIESD